MRWVLIELLLLIDVLYLWYLLRAGQPREDGMIERVGDGYIKFLIEDVRVAEVYALSTPGMWRARIHGQPDVDFRDEQKAVDHVKGILGGF
jgi:hypothetical protein